VHVAFTGTGYIITISETSNRLSERSRSVRHPVISVSKSPRSKPIAVPVVTPRIKIVFDTALYDVLEKWVKVSKWSSSVASSDKYVERLPVTEIVVELASMNIVTVLVICPVRKLSG
jgi:hypothetical protein